MKIRDYEIDEKFAFAGRNYVTKLRDLGLDMSFAALAVDKHSGVPRVVIVSRWADLFGSEKLYELLIEAYQKAKLPREIDPFHIEIFSERTFFSDAVQAKVEFPPPRLPHKFTATRADTGAEVEFGADLPFYEIYDLLIVSTVVYLKRETTQSAGEAKRGYRMFQSRFEQLLAA